MKIPAGNKALWLGILICIASLANAQPAHDNPCGAINLTLVESADGCTPTMYSTTGATYLNLSLPASASCPGPATLPNNPDYWFKFTATTVSAKLAFIAESGTTTGGGSFGTGANYFVIYKASNCNGPFTIAFDCGRSDLGFSTQLNGLVPGDVYYLRFVSALANVATSDMGICISSNFPSSAARVGINTKSPGTNFDVAGNALFRHKVQFDGKLQLSDTLSLTKPLSLGSSLGTRLGIWGNMGGVHYGIGIQPNLLQIYSDLPASDIAFGYGSSNSFTQRARVINSGELGLQVNGRLLLLNGSGDLNLAAGIWMTTPNNASFQGFIGVLDIAHLGFYSPNPSVGNGITFDVNTGNVGVGTPAANRRLEVIGGPSGQATTLMIGNRGGFGPASLEFVSDYGLGSQWRPGYIASSDYGNFTGRLEFYTNGTGSLNLNSSVKGFEVRNGAAYTATGAVGSYSDERLKKNITAFTDGLNVINAIEPMQFEYNELSPFQTKETQVGVMAQQLEKLAPYMVHKDDNDKLKDMRWVNNQAYTFLLINAVKELQKQNDAQQAQLLQQQAEIDALKKISKKHRR